VTWTVDLLTGIAQDLNAANIGTYTEARVPTLNDSWWITLGAVVQERVTAIGLTAYSPTDDAGMADVVQPVQFYLRGTPDMRSVQTVGDQIFDRLHGVQGRSFNGVACPLVRRVSALPLGVDGNGNYIAAHNYYFAAMRATTSRPD
jgi:hypothetical protein